MPLEILSDDLNLELQKKKEEKDNTIGCHIKIEGDLVKLSIPLKVKISDKPVLTPSDQTIKEQNITLTFSKREVKELLQDLYVN